MSAILLSLALYPFFLHSMEEDSSPNLSSNYIAVAVSTENDRTLFKSKKFGNVALFRTGLHTENISIESDIFAAEEKPEPQLSPSSAFIAYAWKKNIYIFPWGQHRKATKITFTQKPTHLAWGNAYTLFVTTQSAFCAYILNALGEPVDYVKGSLNFLPISEIYTINPTTLVYQKSSTELVVQPTKPDDLAIQYILKNPIRLCAGENGTFTCINNENRILIFDYIGTKWSHLKTSISEPSALSSLRKDGVLFAAIANNNSPYDLEIITRHADSDTETVFEIQSFDAPITKIVWTNYGSKNIVCIGAQGAIHTINTSDIFSSKPN